MSDTNNTDDEKTLRVGAAKPLSVGRTVDSGQVRQKFSHGRTRSVVVEKKRRRIVTPDEAAKQEAAPAAPSPAVPTAPIAKQAAPVSPAPVAPPADPKGSGMVLRSLTNEEKDARVQALNLAKEREAEDRRRAEEERARLDDDDRRRAEDRKAAEDRKKEEEGRLQLEEEQRVAAEQAAVEEAARAAADAPDPDAPAPARGREAKAAVPQKRPEQRPATRRDGDRRKGRLTLANALNQEDGRERSMAAMRRHRERIKKQTAPQGPQAKRVREVVLPETITIKELADRMAERAVDIVRYLMKQGQMLKPSDVIDADLAEILVDEFGHTVKRVTDADVEVGLFAEADDEADLVSRPPVVTIMGHVDHGKTSLLDALRETDVVTGEAGGITQHIGAYQVSDPSGKKITFIDTPGHAAFSEMRARGANVTDIVILVVAADDGVMPQTIEAINHARVAEVPIIVAINKMDKEGVDPTRVRTDLLQHEIVVESMSGDVLEVEVSALKKTNLDKLLDAISLQSEVLELKANPDHSAEGVVVEARLDKGRGPVSTILVQRGTLKIGDIVVAGTEWGRARAMLDDHDNQIKTAGPSVPVEVLGLSGAPLAGDSFAVVENEARAREITEYRDRARREKQTATMVTARGGLEDMMNQSKAVQISNVPVVIKGDVQGSVEAISGALNKLGTDEVNAQVLHAATGGITESDVTLAIASGAAIIGFNVRANKQAREAAAQAGIEIRYYSVIYDLVDDIKAIMSGLLSPEIREEFLGNAKILEVFDISKLGKIAGCTITEGKVQRGANVRLIRDDVVIHEGELSTLKRFKDEVREVVSGQECGMGFEKYHDLREGDVIECFNVEKIARSL